MALQLRMSKRFQDVFERASLHLKDKAIGATHDLVNRHRTDPGLLMRHYNKVAGLKTRVLEVDIGGGERLLATYSRDEIALLDMGNHEVTGRYSEKKLKQDGTTLRIAHEVFWPERSSFFRSRIDLGAPIHFPEEIRPDWVYYLSDEQTSIYQEISDHISESLEKKSPITPQFVLGGPGTGKTTILLNLLYFFRVIDPQLKTRVILSKPMVEYLERSTSTDFQDYVVTLDQNLWRIELLLVDDPYKKWHVERLLDLHARGGIGALVVAFDPLQLEKALSDDEYRQIVSDYGVKSHVLKTCYRQKENVGREAKHVIDTIGRSSRYGNKERIEEDRLAHRELTTLANSIEFVNPAGHVDFYPETTRLNIRKEVNRILRHEYLMWKHYPGLLVVEGLSQGYVLPDEANLELMPLEARGYVKRVSLFSVEEVKGLEFQHVFIFIDHSLYQEVQVGFSAKGTNVYNQRRLFRIPFSRAKDSLIVFALPSGT